MPTPGPDTDETPDVLADLARTDDVAFADLPASLPPLALDIDGTLTTPVGTVDPRVFAVLPAWPSPVAVATGKSFPYPVALCQFVGIPERVIAENGGVVCADGYVRFEGDPDLVAEAVAAFEARGGDLGWDAADTVNRWRETEVAARLTADEALLREVADEFDLEFLDTGYAYHVKARGASKGSALREVADVVDRDPDEFVAVGDSENDASTFGVAGESYAVANADETAKAAADTVTQAGFMDGTIAALADVIARAEAE
ncbi:HAD-IIB family hydrolase [Candidatus Halobonum tyrrellensis]|uniref:Phosphoglycolate phosphatase n=1 Tax=Candidatus Halobonum tyrrellensis G22 TaxID=1324957 RepID=V4GRF2_9EURY|nr:HAD-IIB family hydrolase [Candidatus Halobonum tyrrellensis]ESP87636.1 phosphoglycolate phosphatase [Candidatus Halobonum tyrrellensis G22]